MQLFPAIKDTLKVLPNDSVYIWEVSFGNKAFTTRG